MTVEEQLRAFRRVMGKEEVPWGIIRRTNIQKLENDSPNLTEMKMLLTSLSNANLNAASLARCTTVELVHLATVFQAALQFSLWSQYVIRNERQETRNLASADNEASAAMFHLAEKSVKHRYKESLFCLKEDNRLARQRIADLEGTLYEADAAVAQLHDALRKERSKVKEERGKVRALQERISVFQSQAQTCAGCASGRSAWESPNCLKSAAYCPHCSGRAAPPPITIYLQKPPKHACHPNRPHCCEGRAVVVQQNESASTSSESNRAEDYFGLKKGKVSRKSKHKKAQHLDPAENRDAAVPPCGEKGRQKDAGEALLLQQKSDAKTPERTTTPTPRPPGGMNTYSGMKGIEGVSPRSARRNRTSPTVSSTGLLVAPLHTSGGVLAPQHGTLPVQLVQKTAAGISGNHTANTKEPAKANRLVPNADMMDKESEDGDPATSHSIFHESPTVTRMLDQVRQLILPSPGVVDGSSGPLPLSKTGVERVEASLGMVQVDAKPSNLPVSVSSPPLTVAQNKDQSKPPLQPTPSINLKPQMLTLPYPTSNTTSNASGLQEKIPSNNADSDLVAQIPLPLDPTRMNSKIDSSGEPSALLSPPLNALSSTVEGVNDGRTTSTHTDHQQSSHLVAPSIREKSVTIPNKNENEKSNVMNEKSMNSSLLKPKKEIPKFSAASVLLSPKGEEKVKSTSAVPKVAPVVSQSVLAPREPSSVKLTHTPVGLKDFPQPAVSVMATELGKKPLSTWGSTNSTTKDDSISNPAQSMHMENMREAYLAPPPPSTIIPTNRSNDDVPCGVQDRKITQHPFSSEGKTSSQETSGNSPVNSVPWWKKNVGTPVDNVKDEKKDGNDIRQDFSPDKPAANVSSATGSSESKKENPKSAVRESKSSENTSKLLCRHCETEISRAGRHIHESNCEMRPVKCPQCSQSVPAKLLPDHKCDPSTKNDSTNKVLNRSKLPEEEPKNHSPKGPSLNLSLNHSTEVRASSLMLQQTQRELQALLDEEAAEEAKKKGL